MWIRFVKQQLCAKLHPSAMLAIKMTRIQQRRVAAHVALIDVGTMGNEKLSEEDLTCRNCQGPRGHLRTVDTESGSGILLLDTNHNMVPRSFPPPRRAEM